MGGVVLIGATCAVAQDWPQWRGVNRDGKATGFTLTQKWKVSVGAGDSTPALVGDKLYVFARQGEDEVTLCLNAADGSEVWKDKNPAAAIGGPSARTHGGPRSSPAVAEGKVVTIGIHGVVSCLNAADGKVLWRKDDVQSVPQFFTSSSPLIADGMAIAHLGGAGNGGLMAFDLATGAEKWKCDQQPPMYASPVLQTLGGVKTIVSLGEKNLFGVALADGKLIWQVPFAPTGRMSYNACTPVVDGDTVYIAGSGRGMKAFKIEQVGDAVKELWSSPDGAVQFNTPVLKDGLLFGYSDKGSLFCVSAKDGKSAWTKEVRPGRGTGFCAVVDAGAVLFALPNNSELMVYKPTDKGYEELAKIKVADAPTYATPVLSGNRIFVKDEKNLTLWTLP
jgi:outer membrane protein assembly factor BamB